MSDEALGFFRGACLGFVIGMALGIWICGARNATLIQEAVDKGHAVWHVDKTGKASWHWVDRPLPEEKDK